MFQFGSNSELNKFVKKTLPKNFAEQILNLEVEVELNEVVQIDIFQQLIELYMAGVEYYESIKDRKHIFFQRRLSALMTKPSFILATQHNDKGSKKEKFEENQKKMEMDLMYSSTESKEVQVKELVNHLSDSVQQIENIIKRDLGQQSDHLAKRLENRRRVRMSHSRSQPSVVLDEIVEKVKASELSLIKQEFEAIEEEQTDTKEKKWMIIQQGLTQREDKKRTQSIQNKRQSVLLHIPLVIGPVKRRSKSAIIDYTIIERQLFEAIVKKLRQDAQRLDKK